MEEKYHVLFRRLSAAICRMPGGTAKLDLRRMYSMLRGIWWLEKKSGQPIEAIAAEVNRSCHT